MITGYRHRISCRCCWSDEAYASFFFFSSTSSVLADVGLGEAKVILAVRIVLDAVLIENRLDRRLAALLSGCSRAGQ